MTRGHVTELLSPYLDEQVAPGERERVEAHLRECAACRAHLESLRHAVALLRGADPVPAPAGFQEAVRSRLSASAPAPRGRVFPRITLSWTTAAAAAAVVLVGIFSVNLLRGMGPDVAGVAPEPALRRAPQSIAPGAAEAPGRAAAPSTATDLAAAPPGLPSSRQIVRTAHLALAVDDFEASVRALIGIAEGVGGFIASSSSTQMGRAPEGVFTLRVPAASFSRVVLEVERLGTVETRRIGGQDVTEEVVDLGARIRNLERHESALLSFMERATRVSDLLAIEQELARVRGQIEALTGRLRLLGSQVELAAVEVAMRQKVAPAGGGFWDLDAMLARMKAAFLTTLRQMLAALEKTAVVAAALAPLAVLAALVWLAVRRYRLRAV